MSKSPDDPNVVDLTDMVRVNDDEFDPNAVDYHPEGSPVDEFATKPLKAPAASASGDDDTDPGIDDDEDEDDFADPDMTLINDECLERIDDVDDEDITDEVPVVEGDNLDDSGALCLSPSEASIGIEADGISNHCGPISLMDNLSEFMNSIPMSADEPKPISEVVRSSGQRQSIDEFLNSIPADYIPGKMFRVIDDWDR